MLSLQQRLRRLRPPLQLLQQPVNVKQGQSLYGKCPLTWQTRIQKPICLQIIGENHALKRYDWFELLNTTYLILGEVHTGPDQILSQLSNFTKMEK